MLMKGVEGKTRSLDCAQYPQTYLREISTTHTFFLFSTFGASTMAVKKITKREVDGLGVGEVVWDTEVIGLYPPNGLAPFQLSPALYRATGQR